MRLITDMNKANDLLQSYAGAKFKIFVFSVTHMKLGIRLTLPNFDEVVYVTGVSCERMNGPFSYEGADLYIEEFTDEITGDRKTKISDKSSIFELVTSGGFGVAQGPLASFGSSFDPFLKREYWDDVTTE